MTAGRPGTYLKAGRTKSMYPRAPKHSSSNQRDTHYFCCCLSLIIKQKRGRIKNSHRGRDRGDIFMCNCLLGAKDAPGKESRIVTAFPMPSRQHGVRQKDTESPITGGDLISFKWTWLCFLWNKRAHYWGCFSNGSHVQSERVCSDVIQLIQTAHSQVSTTVAFFNFDPLTTTL